MSTQFVFWRSAKRKNPSAVYKKLMKGKSVGGLDSLDLTAVEEALIRAFPRWTVSVSRAAGRNQTALEQPDGDGVLDIEYSAQFVTVTCFRTEPEVWNAIISAMADLELPLYDPQTDKRFDSVPL